MDDEKISRSMQKLITLSPRARLLLERAAQAEDKSLSAVIEHLILKFYPQLIREEEAALKALSEDSKTKRKEVTTS
jgi:hypothetical protein